MRRSGGPTTTYVTLTCQRFCVLACRAFRHVASRFLGANMPRDAVGQHEEEGEDFAKRLEQHNDVCRAEVRPPTNDRHCPHAFLLKSQERYRKLIPRRGNAGLGTWVTVLAMAMAASIITTLQHSHSHPISPIVWARTPPPSTNMASSHKQRRCEDDDDDDHHPLPHAGKSCFHHGLIPPARCHPDPALPSA